MDAEKELQETQERILNSINELASTEERKGICPVCKGTGWVMFKDENGYEFAKPCECKQSTKDYGRPDWFKEGEKLGKW